MTKQEQINYRILGLLQIIIFSSYPIISLYSTNKSEANLPDGIRALLLSIIISIVNYKIVSSMLFSYIKSNFITSIFIFLFYFYGHIYWGVREFDLLGPTFGRHRIMIPFWGLITILLLISIIKKYIPSYKHLITLLVFSSALIIQPLYSIIDYQFVKESIHIPVEEKLTRSDIDNNIEFPNIYYIILDAYARDDILQEVFAYDNSWFLDSLKESGFYIANCSQSNYSQTKLSLASSLNMNYLDAFYDKEKYGSNEENSQLEYFIKNNQVFEYLKLFGYQTVAFETQFPFTEIRNADYYLSRDSDSKSNFLLQPINSFEVLLLKNSLILSLSALPQSIAERLLPNLDATNQIHRNSVLYTLDSLNSDVHSIPSPKIVFGHIVSPHKPFVFGKNGESLLTEPRYDLGYPNQIHYINTRILEIVDSILSSAESPPIIIIQGDHGALEMAGVQGRSAILNAYYFPIKMKEYLYPNISPVNTFRIILNNFSEEELLLLDDKSHYSNYTSPFTFEIVKNQREGCEN